MIIYYTQYWKTDILTKLGLEKSIKKQTPGMQNDNRNQWIGHHTHLRITLNLPEELLSNVPYIATSRLSMSLTMQCISQRTQLLYVHLLNHAMLLHELYCFLHSLKVVPCTSGNIWSARLIFLFFGSVFEYIHCNQGRIQDLWLGGAWVGEGSGDRLRSPAGPE
jgi:hypothetical protein